MRTTSLGLVPAMRACRREMQSSGITEHFAKIGFWLASIVANWQKQTAFANIDSRGRIKIEDHAALAFIGAPRPIVLAHRNYLSAACSGARVKIVLTLDPESQHDPVILVYVGESHGKISGAFQYDRGAQLAYSCHSEGAFAAGEQRYVLAFDGIRQAQIHGMSFWQASQYSGELWTVRFLQREYREMRDLLSRPPDTLTRVIGEDKSTRAGLIIGQNSSAPFELGITGYIADPFSLFPTFPAAGGETTVWRFPTRGSNTIRAKDLTALRISPSDGVCVYLAEGLVTELYSPGDTKFDRPVYYRTAFKRIEEREREEKPGGRYKLVATARTRFEKLSGGYEGIWVSEGLEIHRIVVNAERIDARASFCRDFAVYHSCPEEVHSPTWPTHASVVVQDGFRLLFSVLAPRLSAFAWEVVDALIEANARFPQDRRRIKAMASEAVALHQSRQSQEAVSLLKQLKAYSGREEIKVPVRQNPTGEYRPGAFHLTADWLSRRTLTWEKMTLAARINGEGAITISDQNALSFLGANQPIVLVHGGFLREGNADIEIQLELARKTGNTEDPVLIVKQKSGEALGGFLFDAKEQAVYFYSNQRALAKNERRYILVFNEKRKTTIRGITFYKASPFMQDLWLAVFTEGVFVEVVTPTVKRSREIRKILGEDKKTLVGVMIGPNVMAPFEFEVTGYLPGPIHVYPIKKDAAGVPTVYRFPTGGVYSVRREDFPNMGWKAEDGVCLRLVEGKVVEVYLPQDINFERPLYYKLAYRLEDGGFKLVASGRDKVSLGKGREGIWAIEGAETRPIVVSPTRTEARAAVVRDFTVFFCPPEEVNSASWPTHACLVLRDGKYLLFSVPGRRMEASTWKIVRSAIEENQRLPKDRRRIQQRATQDYQRDKAGLPPSEACSDETQKTVLPKSKPGSAVKKPRKQPEKAPLPPSPPTQPSPEPLSLIPKTNGGSPLTRDVAIARVERASRGTRDSFVRFEGEDLSEQIKQTLPGSEEEGGALLAAQAFLAQQQTRAVGF